MYSFDESTSDEIGVNLLPPQSINHFVPFP